MPEVTKEGFKHFITNYPNKLVKDLYMISEPPRLTWNDFTKGDWPDSVVASIVLHSQSYGHGEDKYYIEDK